MAFAVDLDPPTVVKTVAVRLGLLADEQAFEVMPVAEFRELEAAVRSALALEAEAKRAEILSALNEERLDVQDAEGNKLDLTGLDVTYTLGVDALTGKAILSLFGGAKGARIYGEADAPPLEVE